MKINNSGTLSATALCNIPGLWENSKAINISWKEQDMESILSKQKEPAAYQPGPLDDVQLQEALTIIAIYAAQMDYKNCKADVKCIEKILEHHPLFVARRREIFAMINKYVNEMDAGDPDKALAAASAALTPEQKRAGFELAEDVVLQDKNLAEGKRKILATLDRRLSISNGAKKRAIQ
jgi:hypothetical protein